MQQSIIDSRGIISDYIFFSKYSRVLPDGRKETWQESVARVMQMHFEHLYPKIEEEKKSIFRGLFDKAWDAYANKKVLGAQRLLQYGGPQLFHHNTRLYNCCATYLNRIEFFQECMYLLLSGCGTGYSVQRCHTEQLPVMKGVDRNKLMTYTIPDSIEGWALATGKLIENYYNQGPVLDFDYSQIRPKGAHISGGFKAPGPEPLKVCHEKIRKVLDKVRNRRLRPFELHYITCIIADAVISGGIRRSAMICMFDLEETEMLMCKTGGWFSTHPELCRSNNSVVILPETRKQDYENIIKYIRQYGEPGIIFTESRDYVYNPCCEVGMYPQFENPDGSIEYGWGFCNLTEINGKSIKTEQDFYDACEAAAILGTFQAAYTNFKVLSPASRKIAERDSLIGVGITGMADNPSILFNPEIQRRGACFVKIMNEQVAGLLGINKAARTTVIKPSGNSSQLLGCGSGIHSYHFRKYIRNIQAADTEQALHEMEALNPDMISPSFWNPQHEKVLSFPIELDEDTMVRGDFDTVAFLKNIYTTKMNWIEEGTNFEHPSTLKNPSLRMNVSCTVSVKDDEWERVSEWIWEHKEGFCGLSFLPESGDLDYPQAPYTSYLNEKELAETYGTGAILSSGLIVDGLKVFGDIWTATNAAMGRADHLLKWDDNDVKEFIGKHLKEGKFQFKVDGLWVSDINAVISYIEHTVEERNDWVRRFKKFSRNYFDCNNQLCANCLKHVNIYHQWQKIKKIQEVDWNQVVWEHQEEEAGSQIGTACAGGACSI